MPWWKPRPPNVEPDPEAEHARLCAERLLRQKREEASRVDEMVKGWRRIRERNHFAAALEQSFRGGPAS